MEGINNISEQIINHHKKFSKFINKLIKNIHDKPDEYSIMHFRDSEDNSSEIIITNHKGKSVLQFRLTSDCVIIEEPVSGMEYMLEQIPDLEQADESEYADTQNFSIAETFAFDTDVILNIVVGKNNSGDIESATLNGSISTPINEDDTLNIIITNSCIEYGEEDDEEDYPEDEDYPGDEDYPTDEEYLEKGEEYDEYDEDEEYDEYKIDFFLNGVEYNPSKNDFDKIMSEVQIITEKIREDFAIRVQEISLLRQSIKELLEYKKQAVQQKGRKKENPDNKEI